jgi:hypothetical protein
MYRRSAVRGNESSRDQKPKAPTGSVGALSGHRIYRQSGLKKDLNMPYWKIVGSIAPGSTAYTETMNGLITHPIRNCRRGTVLLVLVAVPVLLVDNYVD